MVRAMRKAKTMPPWPPMALPIRTISTVRSARSRVVLSLFAIITSASVSCRPEVMKKTFTLGMAAWIKVLLTGSCPGSGSCDRRDESRVGHVSGR
jgi:hypothetical protein